MNRNSYNGFSRYERNGIILLCLLIFISIVSKKYVLQYFVKEKQWTQNDKTKIALLKQQISAARSDYGNNYNDTRNSKRVVVSITNNNDMTSDYSRNNYSDFKIEVNAATVEEYEKLYGIGKVLSQRIVMFRDKLGGFYSIEQIKDVWGIEDSVYQKFKKNLSIKPAKIKKININTATYEELTANPYFFSTIAKQIIGYRTKVEPFSAVEDIKKLYYVRDHPEQFNKLSPFVTIN